ncbi:zinc-binding dehydrogenase [Streptomyces hygroscopicus]|uniref:zinc-binding dehydrogenase n=1 Tax=Streptomyces hygroscopicus TaxID=1912 RepID=UPI00244610DB|nr:zinc-binding dehydrogenase [Streptomyces hygroscopicus]
MELPEFVGGADAFEDAVLELTGNRGVDIVVDPVGAGRVSGSLRILAREGRLLVVGSTGGDVAQIKVDSLMRNNLNLSGVGWGAFWVEQPSYLQEQWAALLPLLRAGKLQPVIGRRFPLEQASQALLELDERRAQGKVLLTSSERQPSWSLLVSGAGVMFGWRCSC